MRRETERVCNACHRGLIVQNRISIYIILKHQGCVLYIPKLRRSNLLASRCSPSRSSGARRLTPDAITTPSQLSGSQSSCSLQSLTKQRPKPRTCAVVFVNGCATLLALRSVVKGVILVSGWFGLRYENLLNWTSCMVQIIGLPINFEGFFNQFHNLSILAFLGFMEVGSSSSFGRFP